MKSYYFPVENEDFEPLSIEVTLYRNASVGSIFCEEIKIDELIIDDAIVESDQMFVLSLQFSIESQYNFDLEFDNLRSDGVLVSRPQSISITIQDNDGRLTAVASCSQKLS